jgi:phytoene dehydrogenase-like protein
MATAVAAPEEEVVVVGAGVAGLVCARTLHRAGVRVRLLEASDGVGGRVRTDVHPDGWLLDRGFHIYLDSYPESRRQLKTRGLKLRPFYAGALVRTGPGEWQRVADPARHPRDALQTLLPANTIGDWTDKLRVGLLRVASLLQSPYDFLRAPETTTLARLRVLGFSERMIDTFWRPFLGGIFFDRELQVSDRLLTFVMASLATGQNSLPERGIGAVAQQLLDDLPEGAVQCGRHVRAIAPRAGGGAVLDLADGASIEAVRAVVVATDGPSSAALLRGAVGEEAAVALGLVRPAAISGVGTVCLYFALPGGAPSREPILYLNGEGSGLVNNACFPSTVSPSYAPAGGGDLLSASLIGIPPPGSALDPRTEEGGAALAQAVRAELAGWWGINEVEATSWRHLATYTIPFAQPGQAPPTQLQRPAKLSDGLYVCGDCNASATLDGAMRSGRQAAEAILKAGRPAAAGRAVLYSASELEQAS